MEIEPIFTQHQASQPLQVLAAVGLIGALSYLLGGLGGRAFGRAVQWSRHTPLLQLAPIARTALALSVPSIAARHAVVGITGSPSVPSPRFETSEYPPPRSLVRAGEITPHRKMLPGSRVEGSRAHNPEPPVTVHPAVHLSDRSTPSHPLFPRAGRSDQTPTRIGFRDDAIARGVHDLRRANTAKERARSHGNAHPPAKVSHYAVLPGDTLWDIASKVLQTDDMREIARYWPRIHRENRDVIGADPNLIRPGQVLTLPRVLEV